MSFRLRLVLLFWLLVAGSVAAVAWAVSTTTRQAFERVNQQHTEALLAQFRREFAREGEQVARQVGAVAEMESTLRMAIDLSRPSGDRSLYVSEASSLAASHQLDFLDLVGHDGTIISSAAWPARFGYQDDWVTQVVAGKPRGAFLERVELPEGGALGLMSVTAVRAGDKNLYVAGGKRLDKEFLAALMLPEGMRALLYRYVRPDFSPQDLTSATGAVAQPEKLAPLIDQMRREPQERTASVAWSAEPAAAETFHAIPLLAANNQLAAVLLVGSSQRELVALEEFIRSVSVLVAGGGIVVGLLLSVWATERVTRPVKKLANGAREVAKGNWNARVEIHSQDEIGQLAMAFNHMTRQLSEQRERLLQAERVAAWRELARRLAHELKNPLFPLQITVENLQRARQLAPDQFEEVFRESTATLLAELGNLKTILMRFGDFAKMPLPQLRAVDLNALVREVLKLFEAQLSAAGRAPIRAELRLDEKLPAIQADADLLRRAIENLVLNAMDAMPAGGTLTLRTEGRDGAVFLTVSDTGKGLTQEERDRLFTPYYTTKQHGTGLGLAIVQSIVSDHGGKICVESEPDRGTTFRIDLPARPRLPAAAAATSSQAM